MILKKGKSLDAGLESGLAKSEDENHMKIAKATKYQSMDDKIIIIDETKIYSDERVKTKGIAIEIRVLNTN